VSQEIYGGKALFWRLVEPILKVLPDFGRSVQRLFVDSFANHTVNYTLAVSHAKNKKALSEDRAFQFKNS